MEEYNQHITVLLNEAVDALAVKPDGVYVDATFGRGGHSRLILSKLGENGRLVVFDKDPQAIVVAQALAKQDKRVRVVHDGFATFAAALTALDVDKIDGALFDLGISSPQIDEAARGLVFGLMRHWICVWTQHVVCRQQNGWQWQVNRKYMR